VGCVHGDEDGVEVLGFEQLQRLLAGPPVLHLVALAHNELRQHLAGRVDGWMDG